MLSFTAILLPCPLCHPLSQYTLLSHQLIYLKDLRFPIVENKYVAVEGICYGISAGRHTITMVNGECSSDYISSDGYVGYRSNSWLFVQEIDTDYDSGADSCTRLGYLTAIKIIIFQLLSDLSLPPSILSFLSTFRPSFPMSQLRSAYTSAPHLASPLTSLPNKYLVFILPSLILSV